MTNPLLVALEIVQASPAHLVLNRAPEVLNHPTPPDAKIGYLLVADTETTGLDTNVCKCIEIGLLLVAYDLDSWQLIRVVDSYNGLQDPGEPLTDQIIAVTGLTDSDLAGQAFDHDKINSLVAQANLVVAHNARFDRPVLERYWPALVGKSFGCSLQQIDWLANGFTAGNKLEMLLFKMGMFYDAHRAINDCWALLCALNYTFESGKTAFQCLLSDVTEGACWMLNLQVGFDDKDALKALARFEWLDEKETRYRRKSWLHFSPSKAALQELLQRIHTEVFHGKNFPCRLGRVSPEIRYSATAIPEMNDYRFPTE